MTNISSWLEDAESRVAAVRLGPAIEEFGRVETIGDGIAMISGLLSARQDEVLRFQGGQLGFVQTLARDRVGCVVLDDAEAIEAGDLVRGTGAVIRTPVGPGLLGRVVDPLGRPLDGGPPIDAATQRPDRGARAVDHRARTGHRAGADRHPDDRRACSPSAAASAN